MTETCCRAASAARIDPASRRPIQRVLKIGGCQSTVCVHGPTLIKQWPERRLETRRFLGRRPEFLAPCRTVIIKDTPSFKQSPERQASIYPPTHQVLSRCPPGPIAATIG